MWSKTRADNNKVSLTDVSDHAKKVSPFQYIKGSLNAVKCTKKNSFLRP